MASAVPVTAQLVGHAFVSQYYNVLHQWPNEVYRFYTDASRLTLAEAGPDGAVLSARSQVEIHNTVMSMGYEECKAEIITVDSSESFGGSVLVLVTGVMHRNNGRRSFVQSFFLAPQARGYFVLNDIFRYLDKDPQSVVQVHKVANGSLEMFERLQIAPSDADHDVGSLPLAGIVREAVAPEMEQAGVDDRVLHQTVEAMATERLGPTEQFSAVDDLRSSFEDGSAEKKSYASILRFQRDNSIVGAQPAAMPVSYQQVIEQPIYSHQHNSAGLLANPPTPVHVVDENALLNSEGGTAELKSLYIKNLPSSITESQLEGDLIKIGSSRPSSVILKSYKDGGVYAFVDFEDTASARNAIEAAPVLIGGRKAHIEERRSTYTAGRGHSRASGRSTFSSNGARDRGPYNTGSSARGPEVYGDRDAPNLGRGARPVHSGYGGSNTRV